jgi:hypothetical protein
LKERAMNGEKNRMKAEKKRLLKALAEIYAAELRQEAVEMNRDKDDPGDRDFTAADAFEMYLDGNELPWEEAISNALMEVIGYKPLGERPAEGK